MKAETSLGDDSTSLIQCLKKLLILFNVKYFPIHCDAPSTEEEKVTAIAIATSVVIVIAAIAVVIVTAVVVVTKIVTVTAIVILCRVQNVSTW